MKVTAVFGGCGEDDNDWLGEDEESCIVEVSYDPAKDELWFEDPEFPEGALCFPGYLIDQLIQFLAVCRASYDARSDG